MDEASACGGHAPCQWRGVISPPRRREMRSPVAACLRSWRTVLRRLCFSAASKSAKEAYPLFCQWYCTPVRSSHPCALHAAASRPDGKVTCADYSRSSSSTAARLLTSVASVPAGAPGLTRSLGPVTGEKGTHACSLG